MAAEVLGGVAGGHEEGCVDFEAPGAALDGPFEQEAGEVAVFRFVLSVMAFRMRKL